jgi:hypothetical protein
MPNDEAPIPPLELLNGRTSCFRLCASDFGLRHSFVLRPS